MVREMRDGRSVSQSVSQSVTTVSFFNTTCVCVCVTGTPCVTGRWRGLSYSKAWPQLPGQASPPSLSPLPGPSTTTRRDTGSLPLTTRRDRASHRKYHARLPGRNGPPPRQRPLRQSSPQPRRLSPRTLPGRPPTSFLLPHHHPQCRMSPAALHTAREREERRAVQRRSPGRSTCAVCAASRSGVRRDTAA